MAHMLYIFAFILAGIIACLAEVLTLQNESPGQALAKRGDFDFDFVSSIQPSKPNIPEDLDLLDIVLVASVDGKFHALNRTSGQPLWSMSAFATTTSVSAPATLGPLVRTQHVDYDPDLTDESTQQEVYIIEPQSGDIYVMANPASPLQLFPFSMAELVDLSPFSLPGDESHRVFVGRKETSLLLLELETGKVKATLDSECPWDLFEDAYGDARVDLDELEGTLPQISAPTEVYIGRTDYHVSIYTRPIDRNHPRAPVQKLSFSTYGPNHQDNHLQAFYRRNKDNKYIQSLPNGEILSFKAKSSEDDPIEGTSHLLWGHTFSTPIVAVFDVLRNSSASLSSEQRPFVLLQPRPRIQDILPSLAQNLAWQPNIDSAYIGLVEETGSLFALSPNHFPLVVFGGAERYKRGRLIDGSSPIISDPEADNTAIDDITRVRKLREGVEDKEVLQCQEEAGDRRCFVGSKRVEGGGRESRAKRLLEGPAQGRFPIKLPGQGSQEVSPNMNDSHAIARSSEVNGTVALIDAIHKNPTGRMWEALVLSLVVGIISVIFALRKMKNTVKTKLEIMAKAEAQSAEEQMSKEEVISTPLEQLPTTEVADVLPAIALPVPPQEEAQTQERPKTQAASQTDIDESDPEGEGEGDNAVAPGKRKYRRGKRGKKKKVSLALPDNSEGKATANGNGNGNGNENGANGHANGNEVPDVAPTPSGLVFTSTSPKPVTIEPSLVVSETILGFGSHGTVVFRGSLQGRAVAVKRLLQDFVTLASREVSILQESDDHPNVIRYYYQEAHANFLYIALELCPASLADIIEAPDRDQWREIAISFDPKKALKQITSGLRHLHALKLVHRDIKPQNILVTTAKGSDGGKSNYRMLISDFGLCKKLDVDQTSFLPTAHGAMAAGTVGWRAPEILRGEVKLDDLSDDNSISSRGSVATVNGSGSGQSGGKSTRLTKSVDIFALGCLFYYTLTSGGHPFGDRFEREGNIFKNAKNLEGLQRFGEEGSEAADLITLMLDPEASARPDTTTCLLHPFFWDSGRRLTFLQDASDRFEIMCRDPKDPNLLTLEKKAFDIVGGDWHSRLDKIFIENLGKFRKYDGRSVQDLLRALRNKKHHYQDLPENVKRHLGPMPEGFLSYFTRRYPRLFLHVHSVIRDTGLRNESMFRGYFELPDS